MDLAHLSAEGRVGVLLKVTHSRFDGLTLIDSIQRV